MTMIVPLPRRDAARRLSDLKLAILENDTKITPVLRQAVAAWRIYAVTAYETAADAFAAFDPNPPDILFINGTGSRHDAATVTKAIRDRQRFAHPFLPVVVVLSEVTRSHVLAARDAGADEFLAYPFTSKSLHERITSIMFDRRGFVSAKGYFGPDRRRGSMARFLGVNRRGGRSMLIDPGTGEAYFDGK